MARDKIKVLLRMKKDRKDFLMYYVDPDTKKERSRTTGTAIEREALKVAAVWETELEEWRGDGAAWDLFRDRFREEHLAFLADKSQESYETALNRLESFASPARLSQVSNHTLSKFKAHLKSESLALATITNYLGHIRAALAWAETLSLVKKAPTVIMPKMPKEKHMRGRPITSRELGKMLRACRQLYPDGHEPWRRFLKLLWLSGLRISEAYRLSWDKAPLIVKLDATPYPLIIIDAIGQKSRQDEATPMAPDLVRWLDRVPRPTRVGYVSNLRHSKGGRFNGKKLITRISEIGRHAGVLVDEDKQKYATAHDLRRSFGTRWALKVRPITLQRMMRHADLETTLKFYIGLNAADVGAELWHGVRREQP